MGLARMLMTGMDAIFISTDGPLQDDIDAGEMVEDGTVEAVRLPRFPESRDETHGPSDVREGT